MAAKQWTLISNVAITQTVIGHFIMQDINGINIEVGMMIKTQQHTGGILPPAPAQIGEVIYKEFNNKNLMCIKFRNGGQDFDRYISLDGKINEVVLNAL